MNLVPDASVVVKWYVPEGDHGSARDLRDDYLDGDHDLYAPALLPFEAINALRYSGYYEGDRLAEAASSLAGYGIELRPFSESGAAAQVAQALDVTVYDASYVALAASLDGRAYTADGALLSAVEGTEYEDRLGHVGAYS